MIVRLLDSLPFICLLTEGGACPSVVSLAADLPLAGLQQGDLVVLTLPVHMGSVYLTGEPGAALLRGGEKITFLWQV
jgi:hypothetical protein